MKIVINLISILLFTQFSILSYSAIPTHPEPIIENIKWLMGTWEMKTSNGPLYESWVLRTSTEMTGKSYTIKGTDTVVIETVRLFQKNGKIHYSPRVTDQNDGNKIVFTSSFISQSKFIVENRKHDFPQVISYTRTGQDELVAEISGQSANGQFNFQTFPMKRKSNAVSRNIDLVQKVFGYFNEHDWEKMASLYTNPAAFKDPALGLETVMQSHDDIIRKYSEMHKNFPDIQDKILKIYPSDDRYIIVEFISTGTTSDGSKWELPLVTIFSIENNLISKDFTYYDK